MSSEEGVKNKKIEVLENLVNEFQNRSDKSDMLFQDAMEKMARVEANLQKALERGDRADKRVMELEADLKAAASCLKQFQQNKNVSTSKEKEHQERISHLEGDIDKMEERVSSAEQNVEKLERRKEGVHDQCQCVCSQREAVEEEQEKACREN